MRIYSAEKVMKWRAEAERRKDLAWDVADGWAENRIVDLVISHENLRCQRDWLVEQDEKLRASRDTGREQG